MSDATDLAAARVALHKLSIGEQLVSWTAGGRTASYTPATMDELKQYIADLEQATGSGPGFKRRPFGVAF